MRGDILNHEGDMIGCEEQQLRIFNRMCAKALLFCLLCWQKLLRGCIFTSLAEIKEQKMTHISRPVASVSVSRVSTNSYAVGSLSVAKQLNTMEGQMYQQSSIWPSFPSIGM